MIIYHDNSMKNTYGIESNWNPDTRIEDYEYVNVYFRTHPIGFDPVRGTFEDETDKARFNEAVARAIKPMGWKYKLGEFLPNGKEVLYVHPQSVSGTIKKARVRPLAEALWREPESGFRDYEERYSFVDLYDTLYDFTDKELLYILKSKDQQIRESILNLCVCPPGRRTPLKDMHTISDVVRRTVKRYVPNRLLPHQAQEDACATGFILDQIDCLIRHGDMSEILLNDKRYLKTGQAYTKEKSKVQ